MRGRKRPPRSPRKSARHVKSPPRVSFTLPFEKDFKECSPEDQKRVIDTLKILEAEGFTPGQRPRVLYTIRGKKIWYLRAAGDIRITFTYHKDGTILLLTIEDHDSLNRHKSRLESIILRLDE